MKRAQQVCDLGAEQTVSPEYQTVSMADVDAPSRARRARLKHGNSVWGEVVLLNRFYVFHLHLPTIFTA